MKKLKELEKSKIVKFKTNDDGQLLVSSYPDECDCDPDDEIRLNVKTRYLEKREALKMVFELIEIISKLPEGVS